MPLPEQYLLEQYLLKQAYSPVRPAPQAAILGWTGLRKSQDNPSGTISEREGTVHISNVKVVEKVEKPAKKTKKKAA